MNLLIKSRLALFMTIASTTIAGAQNINAQTMSGRSPTKNSVICKQGAGKMVYSIYDDKSFSLKLQSDGTYSAEVSVKSGVAQFENTVSITDLKCDFAKGDAYVFKCLGGSRMTPQWIWSFRQTADGVEPGMTYKNLRVQAYSAGAPGKSEKAIEAEFDFSECKLQ